MRKRIGILMIFVIMLSGCAFGKNNANIENNEMNISYEPVVCEYTTTPTCWTVVDCISTNIRIYDNNIVEVYCSDFYDSVGYEGEEISIEYIYGETFEITETQKQNIIDALEENEIANLSDCGDEDSCDGSSAYIRLFDENGEKVHSCGGLNPYGKQYGNATEAIFAVLPEGTVSDVREKATKILTNYLLDNYPDEYDWLE